MKLNKLENVIFIKIFLAITTILSISTFAQENYKIENISMDKGLSWVFVSSICQDNDGYIWVGTTQGLNRYDGYEFIQYWHDVDNDSSISNDRIKCMCLDKEGNLWIGTLDGGINKFNKKRNSFKRYMHIPNEENSLISNTVSTIEYDNDDNLWIGTPEGLNKYSVPNNKYSLFRYDSDNINSLSGNRISCLLLDKKNNLWIGTEQNGLNKLNIKTGKITRFLNIPQNPNSISDNHVNSIFEDGAGNIWVGTYDCLNKYVYGNKFLHYRTNKRLIDNTQFEYITTIVEADINNLWLGSKGGGLLLFNKLSGKFTIFSKDYSLPINFGAKEINALFKDKSNVLWIGTPAIGIFKLVNTRNKFQILKIPYTNSMHWAANVLAACPDINSDSTLWIGTLGSGLIKYNLKRNTYKVFNISSKNIEQGQGYVFRAIHNIGEHKLLIAVMHHGLFKFDKNSRTVLKIKGTTLIGLHVMVKDPFDNNIFWIGSDNGLYKFDLSKEILSPYYWSPNIKESNVQVHAILVDSIGKNKILWAGTLENGLLKINLDGNSFEQFKRGENNCNLSHNSVQTIYKDAEGYLWVGTMNGLNRINVNTGKLETYTTEEGLSHNSISGILGDRKSFLWISTRYGISKYNLEKRTFTNYYENDGANGNFFFLRATATLNDGRLFFGGYFGFTIIDPMANNFNIPLIVMKSFKVHNKILYDSFELSQLEKIELPYESNFFSVDFAALDFRQIERNRFSYKLEQFDNDWNFSLTNMAVYKNVEPGEYTFIVKGSNNDGIWNEEGKSIKIVILPPWWMTWWFRCSVGFVFVLPFFVIVRKRIQFHKSEINKQVKYSRQLIELQENERKRIASELHDGLGQNLLLINNELQQYQLRMKGKEIKEINSVVNLVKDSMKEVRGISSDLHPHQLDKLGLKKAIESNIKRIVHATGIECDYNIVYINNLLKKKDEIHFYRILQELCNNIIKHSGADFIVIKIVVVEENIILYIKDNGKGFELDKIKSDPTNKGFGLRDIEERIKILKSNIHINSNPGVGTEVKMVVPLKSS